MVPPLSAPYEVPPPRLSPPPLPWPLPLPVFPLVADGLGAVGGVLVVTGGVDAVGFVGVGVVVVGGGVVTTVTVATVAVVGVGVTTVAVAAAGVAAEGVDAAGAVLETRSVRVAVGAELDDELAPPSATTGDCVSPAACASGPTTLTPSFPVPPTDGFGVTACRVAGGAVVVVGGWALVRICAVGAAPMVRLVTSDKAAATMPKEDTRRLRGLDTTGNA